MRAKRFKEWILESRETTTSDKAKWWFNKEESIDRILGKGLFYLRIGDRDHDAKALEIMKKIGEVLEVNLVPVLIVSNKMMPSTNLWFRAEEEPSEEAVNAAYWKASNTIWGTFVFLDLSLDPNDQAQIINKSLLRWVGRELTWSQLWQLVDRLQDTRVRPHLQYHIDEAIEKIKDLFVELIRTDPNLTLEELITLRDWIGDTDSAGVENIIKNHPNWPEDWTGWALEDW